MAKGLVGKSDPRLRQELCDPRASVAESSSAFLAEAKHYHEQSHRLSGPDACSVAKSYLAMQKKLIGAVERSGNHSGTEAAALAISFESLGLTLIDSGHSARATRPFFRIAARTTDRVILGDRNAEYRGLVSEIAADKDIAPQQVAFGLLRAGKMDQNDPRLADCGDRVNIYNKYHMDEFVGHIKSTLYAHVPNLGQSDVPAYSRGTVLREIAQLPKRGTTVETDHQKYTRYAAFMGSVARISEGVAMNIHSGDLKGQPDVVSGLLATSISATQRCQAYQTWLRENKEVSLAHLAGRSARQMEI